MKGRELYKYLVQQSQDPIIKNPVLRKAVDQERMGFYLGKKVPSQGTIEDADVKKAEDALSGSTDVMKIADLQRQGHIGHYYADGGEVIGKPGGVVEPGITHYAVRKTRSGTEISDKKTKKFKYPYTNQHGTFYRAEPKGVSNPTAKQIEIAEKAYGKRYPRKKGINLWRALKRFERSNIVEGHTTGGYGGVPGGKLKKNMLSKDDFIALVNQNKDKTYNEFVEIIKTYKTKDGKKFTKDIIADRLRSYGLSGSFQKEPAKGRSEASKAKRRDAQLKRYYDMKSTEEGRTKLKEQRRKRKAKEYQLKGIDPPAAKAEEALWKDIVKTAKDNPGNGRFSIDSGYSKSMSAKDFYAGKIKIKDNLTDKTFSYNTVKNYINSNAESFGIEGYRDAMKAYRQKYFINDVPGLRNNLNASLIPGWTGGDPRTAVTIQHDFGRQNNPLRTSIAFYDANEQEYKVKDKFERAWARNVGEDGKIKVTPDIKKAFKQYASDIGEKNIISKPSMVKRDRTFGKSLNLIETLKQAKSKGATIPRGTFKKAQEFEDLLVKLCPKKAEGGRIGFSLGSGAKCGGRRLEQILLRGTKKPQEQILANAILKGGRELVALRNFLGPVALAAGVAFESGIVGLDMLQEGKTFREAVGDSLFNYALGDKYKIDSKEERYKRYKASGLDEEDIGKIALYENNIDEINQISDQFAKEDDASYQAYSAIINPRVGQARKNQLIENYRNVRDETRAFNQDLFRTGTPQRLENYDYVAGAKALQAADRQSDLIKELNKQGTLYDQYVRGGREKQRIKERIEGLKQGMAGGGIASIRRPNSIPPKSGPLPDGLPGIPKRVKRS